MNSRKVVTVLTGALLLSSCGLFGGGDGSFENLDELCAEYCPEPTRPGVVVLTNNAVAPDGTQVDVPSNTIYFESSDGSLLSTKDHTYVRSPSGGYEIPDKSIGLDPRCFSIVDFKVPDLKDIDLTERNTTIKFINLSPEGRVESWELNGSSSAAADIASVLSVNPGAQNEYEKIQDILTSMTKPSEATISSAGLQTINLSQTPIDKTPFFERFTKPGGVSKKEHVFFFVLLDRDLEFNRDVAALIPYSANTGAGVKTLYGPFTQYPVVPETPVDTTMDVLTVLFMRGGTMTNGMSDKENCRYPYDFGVRSDAQGLLGHVTPVLIDPEIEAEGVYP
jgi:hypothetical protein